MTVEARQHIFGKRKKYADQVSFHLSRFTYKAHGAVKLCFIDIPEEIQLFQDNFSLLNDEVYPEDYATFTILNHCLRTVASTADAADADFLVLPFNLFYYHQCKQEIDEIMKNIGCRYADKRVLFFCISDFCLRPVERSMPFERRCLEGIWEDAARHFPAFIRPVDVIIHFESTIDLLGDIAVFPLIAADLTAPAEADRRYLFSFAGQYHKAGWPEGFVRSPSRAGDWEQLAMRNRHCAYIGPGNAADAEASPLFLSIPQQSVFSLCPRGIAPWSFRLFESVIKGAIPVIFADGYVKPFPEYIPWDLFSVSLPESMLSEVDSVLLRLRPDIVRYMQEQLKTYQSRFTVNGLVELVVRKLEQLAAGRP